MGDARGDLAGVVQHPDQAAPDQHRRDDAEQRRHHREARRLTDDHAADLARGRADALQQRHLRGPLPDRQGQRRGDGEDHQQQAPAADDVRHDDERVPGRPGHAARPRRVEHRGERHDDRRTEEHREETRRERARAPAQ
ncbi:hypothetical protein LUX33_13025 [Actinomadura madurae]|nr:hypothetical protein [Actinomadura madurae]